MFSFAIMLGPGIRTYDKKKCEVVEDALVASRMPVFLNFWSAYGTLTVDM